ncbi:MAG: TatD family hydrolase [Desulfobacterales bacterium]
MAEKKLVDTHAHLCDPAFDNDRSEVLERARMTGVGAIIAVGENISDAGKNLDLAAKHPMLRPAAGLYPTYLDLEQAEEMHRFIKREREKLIGIGEVGLDFWAVKDEEEREVQKEIFKGFIRLAKELNLPLNIHSRSAGRHAVSLLLEIGATRVQMHAFDGRAGAALPAVEAGYFFSIPPSIIRSRQKQKLVKRLPLSCLLTETDSPVLGPILGKRNEPANLVTSIEVIAEIKNIRKDEIIDAASENIQKLYGNFG